MTIAVVKIAVCSIANLCIGTPPPIIALGPVICVEAYNNIAFAVKLVSDTILGEYDGIAIAHAYNNTATVPPYGDNKC